MNAFLNGFADEVVKVAARRGLKIIRKLVDRGDIGAASRLAKKPGVLPKAQDLSEFEDSIRLTRQRSPGHQIKHLGGGKEQVATLVADPLHGIAVRKIHRGSKSITVPEQMDLKAALGKKLTMAGESSSPKFLEAFEGPGGRKIHMWEYTPGTPSGKGRIKAMNDFIEAARKAGYRVTDLESKGNVVMTRQGEGKVLDAIVARTGLEGRGGFHGRPVPALLSPGKVTGEALNPSAEALIRYDAKVERLREAALKKRGRPKPPPF